MLSERNEKTGNAGDGVARGAAYAKHLRLIAAVKDEIAGDGVARRIRAVRFAFAPAHDARDGKSEPADGQRLPDLGDKTRVGRKCEPTEGQRPKRLNAACAKASRAVAGIPAGAGTADFAQSAHAKHLRLIATVREKIAGDCVARRIRAVRFAFAPAHDARDGKCEPSVHQRLPDLSDRVRMGRKCEPTEGQRPKRLDAACAKASRAVAGIPAGAGTADFAQPAYAKHLRLIATVRDEIAGDGVAREAAHA